MLDSISGRQIVIPGNSPEQPSIAYTVYEGPPASGILQPQMIEAIRSIGSKANILVGPDQEVKRELDTLRELEANMQQTASPTLIFEPFHNKSAIIPANFGKNEAIISGAFTHLTAIQLAREGIQIPIMAMTDPFDTVYLSMIHWKEKLEAEGLNSNIGLLSITLVNDNILNQYKTYEQTIARPADVFASLDRGYEVKATNHTIRNQITREVLIRPRF